MNKIKFFLDLLTEDFSKDQFIRKMDAIEQLIVRGATEGEKNAAIKAKERMKDIYPDFAKEYIKLKQPEPIKPEPIKPEPIKPEQSKLWTKNRIGNYIITSDNKKYDLKLVRDGISLEIYIRPKPLDFTMNFCIALSEIIILESDKIKKEDGYLPKLLIYTSNNETNLLLINMKKLLPINYVIIYPIME